MKDDFRSFIDNCAHRAQEAQKLESAHQTIEAYEAIKQDMMNRKKLILADPDALYPAIADEEMNMLETDIDLLTAKQYSLCKHYGYDLGTIVASYQQAHGMHTNEGTEKVSKSRKHPDDPEIDVTSLITVYQPDQITDEDNLQLDETNIILPLEKYVIDPMLYREDYRKFNIVPNSVFMYGPAGTGKTTIVKYVAKKTNIPLLVVHGSEIENKYFGNSAKYVQVLFDYVWGLGYPVILFIDEADALLGKSNHSAKRSVISTYLQNTDGIGREAYKRPFGLFLATNEPDRFAGNVLRRSELHLYVGPPNMAQRQAFIIGALKKINMVSPDIDYQYLSAETKDYTCSDLEKAITKASAFRLDRGKASTLTNRMLLDAIRQQGPSINPTALKPYIEFAKRQGLNLPDYD